MGGVLHAHADTEGLRAAQVSEEGAVLTVRVVAE